MAVSPMEQFARGQITALSHQLVEDLHGAARKQDEEAVHRIRVSIRRFVQSLTVFEQYLPESRTTKKVRKQLRRVMRLSSKVRDLDIAMLFLKKHRHPAGNLADRRERAGLELAKALGSGKWPSRLDWSGHEDHVAKYRSVRKNPQAGLPGTAAEFFAAGRKAMNPKRTWGEMHEFRLATKEFRYTLELFRPLFGVELETRLEAVRKIQQLLGDVSDAVSVRKLLKDVDGADPLRKKLAIKAESRRKALILYWNGQFDASGELESWKACLKADTARPKKTAQQKVRSRS